MMKIFIWNQWLAMMNIVIILQKDRMISSKLLKTKKINMTMTDLQILSKNRILKEIEKNKKKCEDQYYINPVFKNKHIEGKKSILS